MAGVVAQRSPQPPNAVFTAKSARNVVKILPRKGLKDRVCLVNSDQFPIVVATFLRIALVLFTFPVRLNSCGRVA